MTDELVKPKKSKKGRTALYTEELAEEICKAIATSSKGIPRLCEQNPHWPSSETIFSWLRENSPFVTLFSAKYARAKCAQATFLTDEMLEIAETNKEDYQVARLKIDTRKWLACKLAPKVFGERVTIETNNDENNALKEEIKALRAKLELDAKKEY